MYYLAQQKNYIICGKILSLTLKNKPTDYKINNMHQLHYTICFYKNSKTYTYESETEKELLHDIAKHQ